jgi:hypothetical protein
MLIKDLVAKASKVFLFARMQSMSGTESKRFASRLSSKIRRVCNPR